MNDIKDMTIEDICNYCKKMFESPYEISPCSTCRRFDIEFYNFCQDKLKGFPAEWFDRTK